MMKKLLSTITLSILLTACNGGNGDGSPAGATYGKLNHNELAEVFVQQLNLDPKFEVSIVQDSTYQHNFVVILDPLSNTFDAINIGNYNPNVDDATDYYYSNSANIYSGLKKNPGYYYTTWVDSPSCSLSELNCPQVEVERYQRATYTHVGSGITFEKIQSSPKDLAKIVALTEAVQLQKSAEFLSSEFGLSLNRGKELAGLKAHWKKSSKKGMTASEVDAFSTELLGFSLTNGIEAYEASLGGDSSGVEELVETAAELNGITPEHASQLMTKVFGL